MYFFIISVAIMSAPRLTSSVHRASDNLRKKLDAEERNAICCRNNLRCCRQYERGTSFEVRAVATNCPNLKCTNWSTTHTVVVDRDKPARERLTECSRKLLLTIKMTHEGTPSDKSQYVIIDHITDAKNLKKVRILNPYVVRIREKPLLQVYDLTFERAVNAEAREKVINGQNSRGYRGCNTGYENPTCGAVHHEGKIVPYSTGFCCSCDAKENLRMEHGAQSPLIVQWPPDHGAVPEYRKNRPEENHYEHYKHYGFTGPDGKMVYGRSQKHADKSVNYQRFTELKDGVIRQRRGGQTCENNELSNLPESLRESTHCLTFSRLWYSVYKVGKPRIVHALRVQIFQKYEDCHGSTHWIDVTQGKVVEMGTQKPLFVDRNIVGRYSAEDVDINDDALNYRNIKLLIPEKRVVDPEEFMILPKKMVSEDGRTCDTAGVGYEAFYKQKKRCSFPAGSCLNNQPQHLYDSDTRAEKEGRRGNFFLKFFGSLAEDPVGYNSTGQMQYLKLMYTRRHISSLYFELNADLVTLLEPNAFASITEVYTDATDPSKTRIIVKVTNSGLLYGVYYVRLSDCSLDVPASFNNIASKSVLIAAQHQHIFNLHVEYPLPVKEFHCSVNVHNINQELLALRQIKIRTFDRCICVWHCKCTCYVSERGLRCSPLPLDSYHAAGFQGGYAAPTRVVEPSYLDEMLAMLFNMFIFLILTLFAMGLIKALLGLCSREIGLWGLDIILGIEKPQVICENKDCQFRQDIGISLAGQFCLNIMFFFLYPLALINICIKKYCFANYTLEDRECSCEERWINYECDDEICPVKSSRSATEPDRRKSSELSLKYTTSEEKSTEAESKKDD